MAPRIAIDCSAGSLSGQPVACTATVKNGQPVVAYRWNFGDGTSSDGVSTMHTWTEPGTYHIGLEATALDGSQVTQHADIRITGHLSTRIQPIEDSTPG